MNAIGWILILLLILVIGFGVFLLVYYFVKIKPDEDRRNQGNTGQTGINPPPSGPTGLSILTANGTPESGVTNNNNNQVILLNPSGPTGPTGTTPTNVCSRYQWLYGGSTGTIGPANGATGPTGPTGIAAVITSGTGGLLQANWQTTNNFLTTVSTSGLAGPRSGDLVVTGSSGSTWIFIPDSNTSNTGKWCLTNTTNGLLCLHYNIGSTGPTGTVGPNQQLTIQEFRLNNTTLSNDNGFKFVNIAPSIASPMCNAG